MPTSPARPTTPSTVWPARGRHVGPDAEDVLRRTLGRLKDSQVIDDFLEVPDAGGDSPERVFEARWRVADEVTVRARLSLAPDLGGGREWTLLAEAEQPWDPAWPSPVTRFWPEYGDWDHDAAAGLSLSRINALPEDDKDVRRVLRDSGRSGWGVHVVVHEAMTTDERGRLPLARWLPPGLRHRIVEHRAAPHQLRVVNWALREFDVEVPRGGAAVLPGAPAPSGYDAEDFTVRTVFLDGSEPVDLVAAVTRFDTLLRPLPEGADDALTALRKDWHLLTLEEELVRERQRVAAYAEALKAMTESRDLYREATERAHEALAAYREAAEAAPAALPPSGAPATSAFQQLTRTLERFKGGAKTLRPAARPQDRENQGRGNRENEGQRNGEKEGQESSDTPPDGLEH
ncbi:hypothetical protein [Streptomyces stelliscabiei]|uniref:hypothetical protein n=1 Tax=Streptomyces stelliscabiei TaxID=146820 RepID=UPI0029AEA514|nr:hypothetical protein [Streptomyces stelliscabiei]MDX2550784.1 hypothetical protein [Streptomyces stelliscabiei]MDX2616833.1 hypothetical protein [Streptomyces stelliscabiei]MDX2635829.1 hypothetical protein [Streptomyces stelliscabiei]MDX2665581.1 hypothetical protein [Streptomyces stelliscabiei]MDX2717835.1 hypothetical protein [Streptomyces stelliscabiei]